MFIFAGNGFSRESKVTGGFPIRAAVDNFEDIVFYATYGNEPTEIDKEEKTIRFKHEHADGTKSFKQFRVAIKIPETNVLEYHITPDEEQISEGYDTTKSEDRDLYRIYLKRPKLDLEKAYKRFMDFLPPDDFFGADIRGAHLIAYEEKTRFTESLTEQVITKIETFEIVETDEGGFIYRIVTTIPDQPMKTKYLQPESPQEVDSGNESGLNHTGLDLKYSNSILYHNFEDVKSNIMSYTAGEEDLSAVCYWSSSDLGRNTGLTLSFLLTIDGDVENKPSDINHMYLTNVTSQNTIILFIQPRNSVSANFGYVTVTNDLSLRTNGRTIAVNTETGYAKYESEFNHETMEFLAIQNTVENRDSKEFPDEYSNQIVLEADLNFAFVRDWPIIDELVIRNVVKRLGVNDRACPTTPGYEIIYEIDNYYTPVVGPQSVRP